MPGKTNVDRSAALYDIFILMLVAVVLALQAGKAVVQISQRDFYCNHSMLIMIDCNLAYFSKSVNYRLQEEATCLHKGR
jgi:hypothetical protein